ncbi:Bug family tripartite tricarboxylate transporter substrate binding protein [Comamonas endophytica]|uniref:Tripartite tricarboxylate transporter substrate binding protein n=1 Tax=Comamonas endophytica TaxID=2949090 RepID=A0ABY6GET6_9BURK|nr:MULTISPECIES: tripartite tricarboxylate transporter substrate binding protein [unclassified Acidovorax]MCD2514362.1 tripartite tricarboxylate transporter substrate binding protein [Acidovorax sp. D4N7]UYG53608.1 tripartite tricarboxylate transporter substrate binding protein [Acidovorax sp. 5MLIR]UYG53653.1 tripartite tricarboxylate transporter substrate binding protein [Acidovorax sp. 5MLIR]
MRRRSLHLSLAFAAIAAAAAPAWSQTPAGRYPAKPVTIIVPFTAGQSGDVLARVLGEPLGKLWGQSLVVENKGGAGGTLGSKAAAGAAADGHTLLLGSSGPLAAAPHLYRNPGYDPRELTPIMNVAGVAQALVVAADSPYKTLQDLLAATKAAPNTLSYGSGGVGSFQHLTFELLKQRTGMPIKHIPYRGSAPAYTDLIGGQLQAMVDSLPGVLPHVKGGKMRVLAVSTAQRVPQLPDVPTIAESGVPGFDALGWLGIAGPKGMDPGLRDRINADLKKVLAQEPVKTRLDGLGMMTIASSAPEFEQFIASELAKWGSVIKAAGIQPE